MILQYQFVCASILFAIINFSNDSLCLSQGNLIKEWAGRLGKELWDFGVIITYMNEISDNYNKSDKVKLETKDPQKIITEIVGDVSYMMKKKMDAVDCIIHAAEKAAKEFDLNSTNRTYEYYRSNLPDQYDSDVENPDPEMYLNISVNNDTHFFNLAVNTNHSSVQIPTNVYHKHDEAEIAIKFSEKLDVTFKQNYNADPALYWQYFGSSSGIMRHYPAMQWGPKDKGLFDCRIRTWFIEAATCTKDVVILVDASGSMTGMNRHIASLTVNTILDTLSNNDYINVMNYSETVNYTVPCFKDILVQATEENIQVFKDSLKTFETVNKSFIDVALIEAFELLRKCREARKGLNQTKFSNQAIMLVTDGIPTNLSDIINKNIRVENESIPIRIFTFLVGKEATHLSESVWIACSNRGYHSHVDTLERVTASVYKYIMVFAQPLVLHGVNPLSWTHAYYDDTFDFENETGRSSTFDKYRLLTSVAGPVLEKANPHTGERTSAKLLGVAATDVPVAEIAKLMYAYKTGVNSHSFIVSNNGYVLKHPDLRPMFRGKLKNNYNSIDLTEVEQLDDDLGPRKISETLQELRNSLVNGSKGIMNDVKIKYHYDDMRRISREVNDYHYAPITATPFSIAFAIPDLYGNYSIEVQNEIRPDQTNQLDNSSLFSDLNWKIHPKWVYCKYHYLEGHEFETPEEELIHFIGKMNSGTFKWSRQYEVHNKTGNVSCGAQTLGHDDYYCDENLVQRLIFDLKNTKYIFDQQWGKNHQRERNRILYNASLHFVATMSGLTRWKYIPIKNDGPKTFGELHPQAIDETWYKSAVIQHRFNSNSFVYSVPFDSQNDENLLVTGSFAIFLSNVTTITENNEEKEIIKEAPAAVVGFQFSHSHLKKRFLNIVANVEHSCKDCLVCGERMDCYVVDSSGYVIISKDNKHTGMFFGEIDGDIMEVMIIYKIFEKVTIRDYQAVCYYDKWTKGSGNILTTPFYYLFWLIEWILSQIMWVIVKTNLKQIWDPRWIIVNAIDQISTQTTSKSTTTTTPKPKSTICNTKSCNEDEELWHIENKIPKYEEASTACEKERDLYILRQDILSNKNFTEELKVANRCRFRPFYIELIPHSNLVLIAANTSHPTKCYSVHTTRLRDIVYENETMFPCQKLYLNNLTRRPLTGCYSEHTREKEIVECGKASRIHFNVYLLTVIVIIFLIFN